MPAINEQGQVLMGNGAEVSVDGTVIAPRGTCAQWWNDNTAVYQTFSDGAAWIEIQDVRTRQPIPLTQFGCNFLAARKGCFGGWNSNLGLFGTVARGVGDADAGLAPCGTDGRAAIADNGAIAVKPSYQSNGPIEIVPPGARIGMAGNLVIPGSPNGLFLLDSERAVWNGGATIGMDPPELLPGAVNIKCIISRSKSRWWVYWAEGVGLVAHRDGSINVGYLLSATDAFHHAAILDNDGRLRVAWSTGPQELSSEARSIDVWAEAWQDLTRLVVDPITPVGVPRWMVWFEFGSMLNPAPQNGSLLTNDLILRDVRGTAFAQYIAVEMQGNTPEAYLDGIQLARLKNPTLPVAAYVPWQVQRLGYVPPSDWVAVEMYKRNDETFIQAERRWKAYASLCKKVLMIPQCYTSNSDQTTDLASLVPLYSRILQLPNVVGAAIFSNSGRKTGLNDHPEVRPLWEALFRTIPSAPPIVLIKPSTKPPVVVPPIVVPPIVTGDDDMPRMSDDKFNEYLREATPITKRLYPSISDVEIEQSLREAGDRRRRHDKDPSIWELVTSPTFRLGKPLSKKYTAEELDALEQECYDIEVRLRR